MIMRNPEHLEHALLAKSMIKKQNKPGTSGKIWCPRCAGTLSYSIARNGHTWARCATPDCLGWME